MNAQRAHPSPLAEEGANRRRRGAGEGAKPLTGAARRLRSRMTDPERKLWLALKDRRFEAYKFRRQVPVGRYIADFLCFESRLIVEVDGGQHADSQRDKVRDNWLVQNNFRVVRFWNNDVLMNAEGVLMLIEKALAAKHESHGSQTRAAPHPILLPQGEKGSLSNLSIWS